MLTHGLGQRPPRALCQARAVRRVSLGTSLTSLSAPATSVIDHTVLTDGKQQPLSHMEGWPVGPGTRPSPHLQGQLLPLLPSPPAGRCTCGHVPCSPERSEGQLLERRLRGSRKTGGRAPWWNKTKTCCFQHGSSASLYFSCCPCQSPDSNVCREFLKGKI